MSFKMSFVTTENMGRSRTPLHERLVVLVFSVMMILSLMLTPPSTSMIQQKLFDIREVKASISTILRALTHLDLSRKTISKAAIDRKGHMGGRWWMKQRWIPPRWEQELGLRHWSIKLCFFVCSGTAVTWRFLKILKCCQQSCNHGNKSNQATEECLRVEQCQTTSGKWPAWVQRNLAL